MLDPMHKFLVFTLIRGTSEETLEVCVFVRAFRVSTDKVTLGDDGIERDIKHCEDTGRLRLEIDTRFTRREKVELSRICLGL